MNLVETPAAVTPAAGSAPGAATSGAVKQAGGVPPVGTTAAHPKAVAGASTTEALAAPALMSATAFDTSATRALQVAAPVKPASGAGGPSGQVCTYIIPRRIHFIFY